MTYAICTSQATDASIFKDDSKKLLIRRSYKVSYKVLIQIFIKMCNCFCQFLNSDTLVDLTIDNQNNLFHLTIVRLVGTESFHYCT